MLDWINANSTWLNTLANIGVLGVWLLYAQILVNGVRRDRRPHVLINHSKGQDLDSEVLICNMSREAIFVQLVLAHVEADGESFDRAISDVQQVREHDGEQGPAESRRSTSQGPLDAGSYLRLGTFRQISRWASPDGERPADWQSLELRVVFFYGPEDKPLAATRTFGLHTEPRRPSVIRPQSLSTRTLRSWRNGHQIQRWLRDHL